MPSTTTDELQPGSLVAIRGQKWVVSEVDPAEGSTLVALQSVEDGRYGDTLEVRSPLRDLESLAARCPDIPALAAAIAEEYKDSRPGSATALARKLAPLAGAEQEEARKKLLVVVRGDYPLAERLLPFSGLIRTDLRDLPVIVLPGRRRRPSGHRTSRQTK